ncbi:MAG: site-2 protease family protein [Thermomicrobiales bacterium]
MANPDNSGNIIIGHVWGIPIQINPSMFLILGLITWSLAGGLLPNAYPEMTTTGRWLTALLTALLFLASILVHELAHAWEARRQGIPVLGITLYIFGGLAQIAGKPKSPGAEFRVAAIGPASSLLLAAIFFLLHRLTGDQGYLGASTQWLGYINLLLAVFNVLPGYPLDGGRILESIVWGITGKQSTGVRAAGIAGQVIAYILIGVGFFRVLRGDLFGGLWSVAIGFFLHNAATTERRNLLQQNQLDGVPVSAAMGLVSEPHIAANITVQSLVENHVLSLGQGSFIITVDRQPAGVLALPAIADTPRDRWATTTCGDLMTPITALPRVAPTDTLLTAVQLMSEHDITFLPVYADGRMTGLLTRDEIFRYLSEKGEAA